MPIAFGRVERFIGRIRSISDGRSVPGLRGNTPLEPVENGLVHRLSFLEVLDDDALEQSGSHSRIPDAFRINNHYRSVDTHAETRCLAAFHALRTEEKILPLQQLREQGINLSAAPTR